jgi:hypothetical protein
MFKKAPKSYDVFICLFQEHIKKYKSNCKSYFLFHFDVLSFFYRKNREA